MTPIRLPMGIVNAYLLRRPDGDVLVDTGLPGTLAWLLGLLTRAGSGPDRLRLIVITHVHFDHVGNLGALQRLSGAPVLVHRAEADLLRSGQVVLPAGQTPLARLAMAMGAPIARRLHLSGCAPTHLVDDELDLRAFGLPGRVWHTPAHTAGSLSVVLEQGDAVVGDLCQYGWGFGMGMGAVLPPLADMPEALPGSYRRVLDAGARRIYPGHGRPFAAAKLQAALDRRSWPG